MKKAIAFLLVTVLLCALLPAAAADTGPSFVVSSATAGAGDEVTLTVSIANNPGIASFEFSVVYDNTVLEWTGVAKGSLSGTWDVGLGEAITWIDSDNHTENGVVATLTFKVKEGVTSQTSVVSIVYDPDNVFDENADNVDFAIVPGGVTITGQDEPTPAGKISKLGANLTDSMDLKIYVKNVVPESSPRFVVTLADRTAKPTLTQAANADAYALANESVYTVDYESANGGRWIIRIKVFPKWISSPFTLKMTDADGNEQYLTGYAYDTGDGTVGSSAVAVEHSYSFLDYLHIMSVYQGGKYTQLYEVMTSYAALMKTWG